MESNHQEPAQECRGAGAAAAASDPVNHAAQTRITFPSLFPLNILIFPLYPLREPLAKRPMKAPGAPSLQPTRASSPAGLSPCASPGRGPYTLAYQLLTTPLPLPLVRAFQRHLHEEPIMPLSVLLPSFKAPFTPLPALGPNSSTYRGPQ